MTTSADRNALARVPQRRGCGGGGIADRVGRYRDASASECCTLMTGASAARLEASCPRLSVYTSTGARRRRAWPSLCTAPRHQSPSAPQAPELLRDSAIVFRPRFSRSSPSSSIPRSSIRYGEQLTVGHPSAIRTHQAQAAASIRRPSTPQRE